MRKQHFRIDDLIFKQGDPSAYAYVLEHGRVEIYRESTSGRVVLGQLGPGEIFGEMGLVDERPRSASAVVIEDAVLSAITAEEFVQLLFDNPTDGMQYLKALFERLRSMNDRVDDGELRPSQTAPAPSTQATQRGPTVVIEGLTRPMSRELPEGRRVVDRWPFRVGRAAAGILGDNHLELFDTQPYSVSRNHFLIDRSGKGVIVRDRGSYLGTVVNGEKIGGKRNKGEVELRLGSNTVVAGDSSSSFQFKVTVSS